ncbi:hypothetical protein COCON_G00007110 [Conger conger]|uniref:UPAR/Ly6 domain-containing protein n=1 Tax=Conger conger TaxID=82655 RepID=A0A9Q1E1Q9_CONCO|nr:sperm acrosome membrane-associated protein 4-like [Conger conger]KAJ8288052.1 hypothetical protein COCON_G00007110 [Conger conger]
MNKVLCWFLAASVLFVVAESLTCNTCRSALLGICLMSENVTCSPAQPNCYVGKAKFGNIADFIGFYTQGCLNTVTCNTTTTGTILGAPYNATYRCCSTDLCNVFGGANTVQLSLATSAALLLSLWNSVRC